MLTKKGKIIMATTTVILAVLVYGVLANSHIDIFPGVVSEYDYILEMETTGKGMISLLDHRRGDELTVMGYIVAALVVLGLPALVGFFAGKKFGAKK